ncbi:MAG: RnfABCDGE type electron transport complex subunit B [Spirochaetes bacterium]|nr:RnfABCDGE type electron transport complex subunit B [Spirochaetota bacterium]MBU0954104.1 RnfABCDGE type electron transport complex subunit B [Spirochaetota bacterium]
MSTILITIGFSLALAFILGITLGYFKEKFNVEKDPKVEAVENSLPGVNCGACGYPGCPGYAEAVAKGEAPVNKCAPGGKAVADALAALMGVTASAVDVVAVLACQGTKDKAGVKGDYVGVETCRAAKLSAGGTKLCAWGCMGFGDCVTVCQFDAIKIGEDGLPHVDYAKCTGCGLCIKECPNQLLHAVPRDRVGSMVICSNRAVVKASVMKNCKVGCIKCGMCVKACPEQCITMVNGIPVTDYEKCTSCGLCVEKCPTKCYHMLENITGAKRKAVVEA